MISLISFEKEMLLTQEEAELLGLTYSIPQQIGYHNDNLLSLSNNYSFKEDCIEKEGKFYETEKDIEAEKPVEGYWLATKYLGSTNYVSVKQSNHLVDLAVFATLCKHKFFIEKSITAIDSATNVTSLLAQLDNKASMLENLVGTMSSNTFNHKTNVHVGGGFITTYNDLLLLENACTDELQTNLNNGWRIIAVCNQPDQRRPDYILGRYNDALEVYDNASAKRSVSI